MKICVLGLDSATPEIVFGDERLVNLRRLMDLGVYGRLQSVIPTTTIPAWMCMSTSQDPGSLGVYGPRNRSDHSYNRLAPATSESIEALAIWDYLAQKRKKSIIVGVPPNYPPRKVNGISIGCFLTPDRSGNEFTDPPALKTKITELVGEYPTDVKDFLVREDKKATLKEQIFEMSRKQWQVVRWLLSEQDWDYFHFVDIGLDRMQHSFWNYFDPKHAQFEAGNSFQDAIPEYYRWLDDQVGEVLEVLDDETILLIVSDHGAQRSDGGFAINQWLVGEGLLVLNEYPKSVTPFENLAVDWNKTRVWSEGGHCARVFFNVQGREPQGVIPAGEYESFQNEMKLRLESLPGENGQPFKFQVFKPQEIYRNLRNVAPDLIVHFGGLLWRSVGSVGHPVLQVRENDIGFDASSHSQHGVFILTAPNCPLGGEYEGANLVDMAPTLMDLAGYAIPGTMQGRSLVAGMEKKSSGNGPDSDAERIVRDRLAGLGYV
jgi:predicted AlkP superfamily phosphohydrolase/phosphomutase